MKSATSNTRIRELLDILNISQTDFCKRAGLNKSALSNYLNGDRLPRQDQISKIADAFDVNPAWLMGYEVPMRVPAHIKEYAEFVYDERHSFGDKSVVHRRHLYNALLEAAKQCTTEQIKLAIEFLNAFAKTNKKE